MARLYLKPDGAQFGEGLFVRGDLVSLPPEAGHDDSTIDRYLDRRGSTGCCSRRSALRTGGFPAKLL